MSDKSINGAVVEGIGNSIKNSGKGIMAELEKTANAATSQILNTSSPQKPYTEPGKDQKLAQIRSQLHQAQISVNPLSGNSPQPSGPLAEQNFGKGKMANLQITPKSSQEPVYSVENGRAEHGRGAKG